MVASTHTLDNLGVSHIASASQQHQSHHNSQHIQRDTDKNQHGYTCSKINQSARDKRSRLSNVINNLHKKVPSEAIKCDSEIIKTEDGKNSVERNLETLEKNIMTVLSGVIESEEKNSNKKDLETEMQPKDSLAKPVEAITTKDTKDLNGAIVAVPSREEDAFPVPEVSFEPSEANENKVDAAVPSTDEDVNKDNKNVLESEKRDENDSSQKTDITELHDSNITTLGEKDIDACNSRNSQKREETEESPRTLSAIILDRLADRYQDQSVNQDIKKETIDSEVQIVCQELLNNLLDEIIQVIEIPSQNIAQIIQNDSEINSDNSTQSLHCSLPLDKVASILQTCQTQNLLPTLSSQIPSVSSMVVQISSSKIAPITQLIDKSSVKSSMKSASPTVRHLCLYCDRKFLSISLRQRHTERVHQISTGRRSERNSRKPFQQNCQYCVDKCSENLEGLFQHMVSSHSDKYHGCLQCSTRYLTRDALTLHIHEIHSHVTVQMEKLKEPILTSIKESKISSEIVVSTKEESNIAIIKQSPRKEQPSNPDSPLFDNSFYSNVSCNIRENLLHHIDGKIQMDSSLNPSTSLAISSSVVSTDSSSKTPQYQLPIDISLTAVTPVYSKDYLIVPEDYENSSEHAGKPGKPCNRAHPRRVSFEKYNFPSKYDGKEQWSCSIKDLSKFDISTQLTLRKKQRFIKECTTLNRLEKITLLADIDQRTEDKKKSVDDNVKRVESIVVSNVNPDKIADSVQSEKIVISGDDGDSDKKESNECVNASPPLKKVSIEEQTVFSSEFESFMRLKKKNEENKNKEKLTVIYAELTGEWSRPRVYVCGACAERYVTLKELEEHKSSAHPNVWCMHFEFSGDQRELYKHLMFLPGCTASPTMSMKTRQQTIANLPPEKICTKCAKSCTSLAELHRHMLECGGDQAWLLGLFGNSKKKCKWRPFGSRSRRRRQRGMKRNIQNSQTPRNNVSKERPTPSGPRVRPSDRESIQKMLANLPAKRSTRKVLQENAARSQGRLRNVQSRAAGVDNPASRIVKNKAALRNKLLKNAKSFQRKKNLRKEKQLENEAQIEDKEVRKILRKKKPSQVLAVNETERIEQQLKRAVKSRNPVSESPTGDQLVLTGSEIIKKNPISRTSETEMIDDNKAMKNKKRLIDRLSASLKAKTQLRTNDGKFARVAAKKALADLDAKSIKIGRRPVTDPLRLLTRSKLRAAAKMAWKEHTKISRRMTRLQSLDTDKVISIESKSMNSVIKDESEIAKLRLSKIGSRNSSLNRYSLDGSAFHTNIDKTQEISLDNKIEQVSPAIGRGRRSKLSMIATDDGSSDRQSESLCEPKIRNQKIASSELVVLTTKMELKTRRSFINKESTKEISVELSKKCHKSSSASPFFDNKEVNKEKLGLTTRSNSRIRKDCKGKSEYFGDNAIKKNSVPKEISEKKISKRLQKEIIDKKLTVSVEKSFDLEAKLDASFPLKKEKVSVVRKSLRNKEADIKEIINEIEGKVAVTVVDVKFPSQTAEKHLNYLEDKKISEVALKKVGSGKRRGRTKHIIIDNTEDIKSLETPLFNQENEKVNNHGQLKSEAEESTTTSTKLNPVEECLSSKPIQSSSNLQNLNLEHLQQESSNSNMDSGKENSLETIVNISKLKVVRPKKWRGLRRESKAATTKRSLNSVIGILTEGVNVPVDAQDTTVVLTVQTSVDTNNSENNNVENTCQSSDELTFKNDSSSFDANNKKSTEICNLDSTANITVFNIDENAYELGDGTKHQKNYNLQCYKESQTESTSILEKPNSKSNLTNPEQPANDIILDLSRRKSKGKGSFLEKIVSKIAKQKDVSLDNVNSCHAEGEHISVDSQNNLHIKPIIKENNSTKEFKEIGNECLSNEKINTKSNVNTIINNAENTIIYQEKIIEDEDLMLLEKDIINDTKERFIINENNEVNENSQVKNILNAKDDMLCNVIKQAESAIIDSDPKLHIADKKSVEMKIQQKQKSKKRSFENNVPKKNKKKNVDSENKNEENKEEISLADIMKLIDRSKSKEILNNEQKIIKLGKRKTPDDDMEFNVNTNIEVIPTAPQYKRKEIIKIAKKRSGQTKNKNNIDCTVEQIDIKKKEHSVNIDVDREKLCRENIKINLSNACQIILQDESAIISELTTNEVDKNDLLKYQAIKPKINDSKEPLTNIIQETKSYKQNEFADINNEVVQNSEFKDSSEIQNITKQKKMLKTSAKFVKSQKSYKNSPILISESFKVPESTESMKPTKKHISGRKFNLEIFSNNQVLERNVSSLIDKQTIDKKLGVNYDSFDQYSSLSDSEEKSIPKRTFKRYTRNNKHLMPDKINVSSKESDDFDVSPMNELQPLRRRRSHRTNIIVMNNDVSLNSFDKTISSTECNSMYKQNSNMNIKNNILISNDCSKLINDSDISTESGNNNIDVLDNVVIVTKTTNENNDKIDKTSVIEKKVSSFKENEEPSSASEDETEINTMENVNNTTEIESVSEIDRFDDKISYTPNSHASSLDDNFDIIEETLNYDLQIPKKRLSGNFTVVTKSGKILIVEKKKKLTKEIAKFFCNICTTSFTRKSSLKKHNLSQSHILQININTDKDVSKDNQYEISVESVSDDSDQNVEQEKEENKEIKKDFVNRECEITEKEIIKELNEMQADKKDINVIEAIDTSTSIILKPSLIHKSPEEELEDEMLDEEICKITENMSHDEYVLTDQVSPVTPEVALTLAKEKYISVKEIDNLIKINASTMKAISKKKKEKKKKNLADEHLNLDTPVSTNILQLEVGMMPLHNIGITNYSVKESIPKNELNLNKTEEILRIDDFSENVSKEDTTVKCIDINNKIENKSKKHFEKKIIGNEIRRTNCNRNQNIGVEKKINIFENSRPKRNQLRPSYKEDENFDFDLIESPEAIVENKSEFSKSKKDKTNFSLTKIIQHNYDNVISLKKFKDTSKSKRIDSNINLPDFRISNSEKESLIKKNNGKSQNKKKFVKVDKEHNIELLNLEMDLNKRINENLILLSNSKLEKNKNNNSNLKQVIIDKIVPEIHKNETLKKKRGRKPKQMKVNKEIFVTEENIFTVCNKVPIVVLEPVKENHKQNKEPEFHINDKSILKKVKSNRQKDITDDGVANKIIQNTTKSIKAIETKTLTRERLMLELKQKNYVKKPELNTLFDIKIKASEKTLIDQNELNISSVPTEASKFPEITVFPEDILNKISVDVKQQLIFPNLITDNSKTAHGMKNEHTVSILTGFDSDDNSLDTNMSMNIQKLLNDPEMMTEIAKQPSEDTQNINSLNSIELVDVINIQEPIPRDYPTKSSIATRTIEMNNTDIEALSELKDHKNLKRNPLNKLSNDRKSLKVSKLIEKKAKRRGRKPKNNSSKLINKPSSISDESDIEGNKQDDKVQKSKNKIVKSVFGRVFSGEKFDKVKEVLNDWQSRSENNSSDSETEKFTRNSRSSKRKSLRTSNGIKKAVETSCRSRQSKRRAEELIFRAFNNDSPVSAKNCLVKNRKLSKKNREQSISLSKEKLNNEEFNQGDYLKRCLVDIKQAIPKSKKGRKKISIEETMIPIVNLKQSKYKHNDEDIEKVADKLEESKVSQSMIDQDKLRTLETENTNNEYGEYRDKELNGRMLPLYTRSLSDKDMTLCSSSSSYDDDEDNYIRTEPKKNKSRNSASVFVTEKLLIRSPQVISNHEDVDGPTEMVTIAPTDAVEDNALDLEMLSTENSAEKPARQATKVLNFDEELFVECCSRLKATSENELRGTKKIKLDNAVDQVTESDSYHQHQHHHKKDEQSFGYRGTKDRWKDVESQNSLGSLLESVNQYQSFSWGKHEPQSISGEITSTGQHGPLKCVFTWAQLLGEEYNNHEMEYEPMKRGRYHHHHHHHHHHYHRHNNTNGHSSCLVSPAEAPPANDENLSYDDSLDVAFEHNNKLRDKIQQRMRESESLIATSFGQRSISSGGVKVPKGTCEDYMYDAKAKVSNGLGLLDKALSNLLHNNEKHDHNGSTPMKLLAELACARAPTSMSSSTVEKLSKSPSNQRDVETIANKGRQEHEQRVEPTFALPKKSKNSIKELFERKREYCDKRQLERTKITGYKSGDKLRKQKKIAKMVQHNLPLIRTSQYRGGMAERKRRRDVGSSFTKKKEQIAEGNTIKDVYDFDEEESANESGFSSVLSYRVKSDVPKELSISTLLSKTIGDTLANGKCISAIDESLESMIDRKFNDIEKLSPKSKTAFKAERSEDKQTVIGPMDEYVDRRQKSKRSFTEYNTNKYSGRSRKKSVKNMKKKSRNAWYEDDSSDEFVTKLKADDIGVGISKTQRTCSKGKQNLFAEMSSTSSESEYERVAGDVDEDSFDTDTLVIASKPCADQTVDELGKQLKVIESVINNELQHGESQEYWSTQKNQINNIKNDLVFSDDDRKKKFESEELSDHPLVIDENIREPGDVEQRTNTDEETQERNFELDDLYREDSSIIDSDRDEATGATKNEDKFNSILNITETMIPPLSKQNGKSTAEKYISLEDALELLDQPQDQSFKMSRSNAESFHKEKKEQFENSGDDEEELPEKLTGDEKPQCESENLPLHVFLSRKVQESKKRKQQQQIKKLKKEQERMLLELQPTRRQRKCAVGKQGLLAEISSSDEEPSITNKKPNDKSEQPERQRSKQKQRESKEKRKERYIEKKHEQMIAKEQKAIEEEIMRELEEKRQSATSEASSSERDEKKQPIIKSIQDNKGEESPLKPANKYNPRKHWHKQKQDEVEIIKKLKRSKSGTRMNTNTEINERLVRTLTFTSRKKKPAAKMTQRTKKISSEMFKKQGRSKMRSALLNHGKDSKESLQLRSLNSKRESDLEGDEELKAARSWNKVDEGVGVAIGRRKRAAANQLYYWSSSSDEEEGKREERNMEEEEIEQQKQQLVTTEVTVSETAIAAAVAAPMIATAVATSAIVSTSAEVHINGAHGTGLESQEDDRQQQHGWIVGDSHKKMITMLAMEKQMKEKRRRSENDEQSPETSQSAKIKNKRYRNSTS